jgi:hypothetical protein
MSHNKDCVSLRDPECGPCTCTRWEVPMSQERFAQQLDEVADEAIKRDYPLMISNLIAHEAALCAKVDELERDLASSRVVTRIIEEERVELISLREQLDAMKQDRDRLKEKWSSRRSNLIEYYEEQLTRAQEEIRQLNNILRQAGWGQGEIDVTAYTFDKLTKENAELCKKLDAIDHRWSRHDINDLERQLATAEGALRSKGYRKSCDIPACNCGDQWNHGGHAEERLREIGDALPYENGKTILGRVCSLIRYWTKTPPITPGYWAYRLKGLLEDSVIQIKFRKDELQYYTGTRWESLASLAKLNGEWSDKPIKFPEENND